MRTSTHPRILLTAFLLLPLLVQAERERPNIFFFFADDWGRYASIYADPNEPSLSDLIETPNIDRIGREGVLFNNAFVPVASCRPCRASLATGRYFWNCGSDAFLNRRGSNWKGQKNDFNSLPKFGDLLRESGYYATKSVKTFAFQPSPPPKHFKARVDYQRYGLYVGTAKDEAERKRRHEQVVENSRREIQRVLAGPSDDQPFFFVFGSINVHRPYTPDSGKALWGIEPDSLKGRIPSFLPDAHDVRRDFSDYLGEVLALDLMLGAMLEELETAGELDNTVIILSGDHGVPGIPRGKTNCYDLATRVPIMVRWPEKIPGGRKVDDYVSVMDIGPTLLDIAGVDVPESMDGRSFAKQLMSEKSGWIDPDRNAVIIGRERHVHCANEGNLPYPMRAIRTPEYLYVHNLKPERWPAGAPYESADVTDPEVLYQMGLNTFPAFTDIDGSLTKAFLLSKRDDKAFAEEFRLNLLRRPAEELYDLREDPEQMVNLAGDPEKAAILAKLREQVETVMQETHDPRLDDAFDRLPWTDPSKPRGGY